MLGALVLLAGGGLEALGISLGIAPRWACGGAVNCGAGVLGGESGLDVNRATGEILYEMKKSWTLIKEGFALTWHLLYMIPLFSVFCSTVTFGCPFPHTIQR